MGGGRGGGNVSSLSRRRGALALKHTEDGRCTFKTTFD